MYAWNLLDTIWDTDKYITDSVLRKHERYIQDTHNSFIPLQFFGPNSNSARHFLFQAKKRKLILIDSVVDMHQSKACL